MTQDEMIEIAKQAGWKDMKDYDSEMNESFFIGKFTDFVAFAKLVAQHEREACAVIAFNGCLVPPDGGSPTEAERLMCEDIANAIRTRGQA